MRTNAAPSRHAAFPVLVGLRLIVVAVIVVASFLLCFIIVVSAWPTLILNMPINQSPVLMMKANKHVDLVQILCVPLDTDKVHVKPPRPKKVL
jgi:hypothetical protein